MYKKKYLPNVIAKIFIKIHHHDKLVFIYLNSNKHLECGVCKVEIETSVFAV